VACSCNKGQQLRLSIAVAAKWKNAWPTPGSDQSYPYFANTYFDAVKFSLRKNPTPFETVIVVVLLLSQNHSTASRLCKQTATQAIGLLERKSSRVNSE
jgi:hypothetical protein